jgi:ABC-type uncharacterized transport system involved in gliding motility auxiliary subunit
MTMSGTESKSSRGPRDARWRAASGFHAVVSVLLAAAAVAMLNYLAARHYVRRDISRLQYYALADKTRALLAGLSNRVEVTVLFDSNHAYFEDIDNLLKEYEERSPLLKVERIDPLREVTRASERAQALGLREGNVVAFTCEGRQKIVGAGELVSVDYTRALQGGDPEVTAFHAERVFSSAIRTVTRGDAPVVYFLKGSGERDVRDREAKAGYSSVRRELEADQFEVRVLDLGDQAAIPADAAAVVVAGPRRRLPAPTVELLRHYLARDGRLFVLLEAGVESGLEPLLGEWGIGAGKSVVVDPSRTLTGRDLFVSDYRPHPVTRTLAGSTCVFYLPRAIEPLSAGSGQDEADRPRAVSLFQSAADSWAEVDLDQQPFRYEEGRDVPGPISLAVAAERAPAQSLDVSVRSARLVVIGDADFAANGPASGSNYDLFTSALSWLTEREDLLAISPKVPQEMRLLMDSHQLNWLFGAVVAGIPALVAVAGLLVWLRRRT